MTPKRNRELNLQFATLFLVVCVLAAATAGEIYNKRAWFHAGDHIGIAQAAAAIIFGIPTLFLSFGAVLTSIRAAKASEGQTEASNEQAAAARAQIVLAKAQLREAVRPVVSIRRGDFEENATFDSALPLMQMQNVGVGTACAITIAYFERTGSHAREITSSFPMIQTVLPPNQTMKIPRLPNEAEDMAQNLIIFYESVSGDRYCSSYYNDDEAGPLLNYEDDPSIWPGGSITSVI